MICIWHSLLDSDHVVRKLERVSACLQNMNQTYQLDYKLTVYRYKIEEWADYPANVKIFISKKIFAKTFTARVIHNSTRWSFAVTKTQTFDKYDIIQLKH